MIHSLLWGLYALMWALLRTAFMQCVQSIHGVTKAKLLL